MTITRKASVVRGPELIEGETSTLTVDIRLGCPAGAVDVLNAVVVAHADRHGASDITEQTFNNITKNVVILVKGPNQVKIKQSGTSSNAQR
jgi:hypothetical protein